MTEQEQAEQAEYNARVVAKVRDYFRVLCTYKEPQGDPEMDKWFNGNLAGQHTMAVAVRLRLAAILDEKEWA